MTILDTMRQGVQGLRASVTLDDINLSQDFAGGKGRVLLVGDKSASYEKIYRSQPMVRAAVNLLSHGIGRLPLKAYIAGGEPGERERVREGPLADRLARPYEGGGPFDFKSAIIGNLCIHANAIAVKMRPRIGQPPSELIPSSWGYWTVQPGKNQPVDWYWFNAVGGQRLPFRPEEVIHWKWWAPGRGLEGAPPMEALVKVIATEDAAQRTIISSYEHGARPVGGYSVQGSLKEETALRLREQLNENYGGVDNAYKILLMEGGAKWESMSYNLVDSEVINTRKLGWEEVARVFGIPQPALGLLDRATFSNITEQHLMLYQDTFGPWTTMFEETLQIQLIDQEPQMAGQYVEFDLNEVLKGDVQKRYDAYNKAQWWMTPNEVRARENLPPKDDLDADSLHTPLNTRSEEDESPPPAQALLPEARCPGCDRILARDVLGATIRCRDCKNEARFGASI